MKNSNTKNKMHLFRQERRRKPDKPDDFVTYEDSDSEEETLLQQNEVLKTSYNFVDYVRSRESDLQEVRSISAGYASRHILTHDMFKESPISLGNLNKVFCAQWLSGGRQVVFGTKCNKLLVYDVNTRQLDAIPTLHNNNQNNNPDSHGIHAIELNPSRTLLATGARNSSDLAIYRLPTLDPACIGENGHKDWVYDICWLDDQFLVSGSKDTKLALWRIQDEIIDPIEQASENEEEVESVACPRYAQLQPVTIKDVRTAQKIRSICFNQEYKEIAVLSLNSYIHLFNAETFSQKLSRKLPNCQDNVCIACQVITNDKYL